jgi:hypothetical protein
MLTAPSALKRVKPRRARKNNSNKESCTGIIKCLEAVILLELCCAVTQLSINGIFNTYAIPPALARTANQVLM